MRTESRIVRNVLGVALAMLAGVVLALAATSAAQAKNEYLYWNSSSNPLIVEGYGSWANGYGQWRVTDTGNGTRSINDARVWYYNIADHKKYAQHATDTNAGVCFAPTYTSCSQPYFHCCTDMTRHSNVAAAEWLYSDTSVSSWGDYARARVWVCLDIPWRDDPCGGPTYTAGTQY